MQEKRKSVDICTQVSPKRRRITEKEIELKRKVNILQNRLHRRDEKIATMSSIIDILKKNNACDPDLEQMLRNIFSGLQLKFILNEYNNNNVAPTHKRYTVEMK